MIDLTPLTQEVARVTYEAMAAEDGRAFWRGLVDGHEWKIGVIYDAGNQTFNIKVTRRGTTEQVLA